MKDEETLREFITLYLQLNDEPADAQVHALAEAIGADKEALESLIYAMLGETLNDGTNVYADSQDVLEDVDVDMDTIPTDDAAMNDGDNTNDDIGYQEETNDDGADVHDIGVGLTPTDGLDLTDDGALDMSGM